MIDREHDLSITRRAEVLKISRGSVYYLPRPVSAADLVVMQRLDRLHLEYPIVGTDPKTRQPGPIRASRRLEAQTSPPRDVVAHRRPLGSPAVFVCSLRV